MRKSFSRALALAMLVLAQPAGAQFYSSDGRNVQDELVTIARVKVSAAGAITLDDRSVTQSELELALDRLKLINGAVLYFRERATGMAPDSAMAAFRAIIAADLPVSLSTKADFSDYVDPEGRIHTRPLGW